MEFARVEFREDRSEFLDHLVQIGNRPRLDVGDAVGMSVASSCPFLSTIAVVHRGTVIGEAGFAACLFLHAELHKSYERAGENGANAAMMQDDAQPPAACTVSQDEGVFLISIPRRDKRQWLNRGLGGLSEAARATRQGVRLPPAEPVYDGTFVKHGRFPGLKTSTAEPGSPEAARCPCGGHVAKVRPCGREVHAGLPRIATFMKSIKSGPRVRRPFRR